MCLFTATNGAIMNTSIDLLEAEVLALNPADRTGILERLIVSFDEPAEIEAEWIKEALRREAAVAAGTEKLVSGPEAQSKLKALVGNLSLLRS